MRSKLVRITTTRTGLRLLIVEDDPHQQLFSALAAERSCAFAEIEVLDDGREALDYLHARSSSPTELPDAILSDLKMPRMDGIHLARELKNDPALEHIPIVIYTSSDMPNDRTRAIEEGCREFLRKTTSLQEMTATIASIPALCGFDDGRRVRQLN